MRLLLFVPLLAALPAALHAAPLGFDDAVAMAEHHAPIVRARARDADARRASVVAAGQLPDPKLGLGVDNYPVSGPPAFTFSGDSMTMARVGISQEIPNAAKRHARTTRAEADVGEADAVRVAEQRRVRVEAALAWIDLAFAERRHEAVKDQIGAIGRLRPPAAAEVASGSARPAQALAVRQALLALEDRQAEVAAEVGRARAALARWTGDPDPEPSGPAPEIAIDAAALRASLATLPVVELAAARRRQAEAEVELARADKRPDFGLDLAYQRRASRYGDMISAGVTVSLPLFAHRRQDPIIAARAASADAAQAEEEDARRSLEADLDAALADHRMHHEQWARARDALLPLAHQRADLETASYGAGRAVLLDVIEARTALAEAELQALDREATVVRDAVRLSLTYGRQPK
ncbi:MAG: TolC family protein [Sphingomonadales bacterium]